MINKLRYIIMLSLGICSLTACTNHHQDEILSHPHTTEFQVKVQQVKPSWQPEKFVIGGIVESRNKAWVSAESSGQLKVLYVKEGDLVKQGQILALIDQTLQNYKLGNANAQLQAGISSVNAQQEIVKTLHDDLAAAESSFNLADKNAQRIQNLYDKDVATKQELESYLNKKDQAYAHLNKIKHGIASGQQQVKYLQSLQKAAAYNKGFAAEEVKKSKIIAPFTGIISQKLSDAGSWINAGIPLFLVENPHHCYLKINVNTDLLHYIQYKKPVDILLKGSPKSLQGYVREIVHNVDYETQTHTVHIDLPDLNLIHPGQYIEAIILGKPVKMVLIPATAIVQRGTLTGIFVVDQSNTLRFRIIKQGRTIGINLEVLAGIEEPVNIVLNPSPEMIDGSMAKR